MCFSAPVSFTAGLALLALGFAALRMVRHRSQAAFAAIPVLFGIQQIVEGFVWLSFRPGGDAFNPALTFTYSLFSHVLWPVFVPIAVGLMEPVLRRRRALYVVGFVGALVGAYLLYALLVFPITSAIEAGRIVYRSPHFFLPLVVTAYLAATCVSLMLSSHPWVRIFGVLALVSAMAAYVLYSRAFISVWCFFAAVLSVIVYVHVRSGRGATAAPPSSLPRSRG